MSTARDDHEALVASHLADQDDNSYQPVDSTAVLDIKTDTYTFSLAHIKLDATNCDVCTSPVGPVLLIDPASDAKVYVWVPCWRGPVGLVCADCREDLGA